MSMWLDTLYFFRDCAIRGPVRAPGLSPGQVAAPPMCPGEAMIIRPGCGSFFRRGRAARRPSRTR